MDASIEEMQDQLDQMEPAGLGESEEAEALRTQTSGYKDNRKTIQSTIRSLNRQVKEMDSALDQIKSGKSRITTQLQTVDEQSADVNNQMTSAQIQLSNSSNQIEAGKEELESAREEAITSANMTKTITVDTIKSLLQAQNFEMPAGYVTENNVQYLVRVGDEARKSGRTGKNGSDGYRCGWNSPIRLKDVADVAVVDHSEDSYCKINGNDGIILSVQKQSTYSSAEVSDSISEKLDELQVFWEGLHYTNLMDQGIYIDTIGPS